MKLFHFVLILASFIPEVLCVPYANYIGIAYSIAGVALVIPHYMVFKNHLRLLDLLQLCFLFRLFSGSTLPTFSN